MYFIIDFEFFNEFDDIKRDFYGFFKFHHDSVVISVKKVFCFE